MMLGQPLHRRHDRRGGIAGRRDGRVRPMSIRPDPASAETMAGAAETRPPMPPPLPEPDRARPLRDRILDVVALYPEPRSAIDPGPAAGPGRVRLALDRGLRAGGRRHRASPPPTASRWRPSTTCSGCTRPGRARGLRLHQHRLRAGRRRRHAARVRARAGHRRRRDDRRRAGHTARGRVLRRLRLGPGGRAWTSATTSRSGPTRSAALVAELRGAER